MNDTVDAWSDCGNAFNAGNGLWHVEMMQNGWARVEDRRCGAVSLVDPANGSLYTGLPVPTMLAAEIVRRWGGGR